MVELQKTEQRGQAVKRLRSLFDMHRVSFGAPENLNGLLTSLHDDRHFAMDFWSVIGALSEDEEAPVADEEMLDTVVESATGVESTSLPQEMQPQVAELRQLLSGVDIERPAELPEAIAKPDDDLLSHVTTLLENTVEPVRTDAEIHEARKSIGEILARLEQTSRELRDRLAVLEAEKKAASTTAHDEAAAVPSQLSSSPETNAKPSSAPVVVRQEAAPVQAQSQQPILPFTPRAVPTATREHAVPGARATRPAAVPPIANSQQEVFTPRPVHTLSHRGLAIPDPEDDPSIPTPLAGYSELVQQSSGARYGIAALLIVVLGGGAFWGARTEKGHALLTSGGSSLSAWYEDTKQRLGILKREATTRETQPSSAQSSSTAAPAPVTPAPTPAPQANPEAASSTPETQPAAGAQTQASPAPAPTPAPPAVHPAVPSDPSISSRSTVASAKAPPLPKKHIAEALAAAKASRTVVEPPVSSSNAVRVPAAAMARHLIASRVPVYPPSAKAQDIEGPVVMDVVISESGFVKGVRAVDGDKHLRAAAEEAVSKWRYIPYLQNGRPVEVMTTVRLDFRLP